MDSSGADLKRRKALAWSAFWKLEKLWRNQTTSIATKVRLFNTTCLTVLLYGCESWVITRHMENSINAFATSCYRIMLNIKRTDHVLNTTVYSMVKCTPLIHRVHLRQLTFLGHILRMPNDEPAKLYALYQPTHGRRRPGRQRMSYLTYTQSLLGLLEPRQIEDLAQDRVSWRKLVAACCAVD